MKGKLICIEGPDFSGKSTCVNSLREVLPVIYKKENFIYTREPGSLLPTENAKICEGIRKKLLTEKCKTAYEETAAFAMSRELHTIDMIELLNKGTHVICDRYFVSSLIYQGPRVGDHIVYKYNKKALDLLKENNIEIHNIVFTLSYDNYKKRSSFRDADAMENVPNAVIRKRLGRHKDVDKALLELDKDLFKHTYYVNANKHSEDTLMETLDIIYKIIK